ncbi:MAG: polysaccharide biosynthesis/export family protein [Arenicella sp.]
MLSFSKRAFCAVSVLLCVSGCASIVENSDVDIERYIQEQDTLTGSTQPGPVSNTSNSAEMNTPSEVLPGDVIQIRFPFKPEFSSPHQVRIDGHISIPYLGDTLVAGKQLSSIQEEIRSSYNELAQQEVDIPASDKKYLVQAGDILDIRFSYKPELDETVIVRPDGRITLPLVNSLIAESKTPEELSKELQLQFAKFVNKPELVVIVKQFARKQYYAQGRLIRDQYRDLSDPIVTIAKTTPRHIYVGGEVNRPGLISFSGSLTALQAVLMSGGNKKSAQMNQVAIIRKPLAGKSRLIVRNLTADSVDSNNEDNQILNAAISDLPLQANDIVIIPKTNISKVGDFLNQYVYDLIPFLKNSSLGFAYSLNPVDEIKTTNTNTENVIISTVK